LNHLRYRIRNLALVTWTVHHPKKRQVPIGEAIAFGQSPSALPPTTRSKQKEAKQNQECLSFSWT
jgi:hypothetical protein